MSSKKKRKSKGKGAHHHQIRRTKSDTNVGRISSRKSKKKKKKNKGPIILKGENETCQSPLQLIGKRIKTIHDPGTKTELTTTTKTSKEIQRSSSAKNMNTSLQETRAPTTYHDIQGERLIEWAYRIEKMGESELKKEYFQIRQEIYPFSAESFAANKEKNRYIGK